MMQPRKSITLICRSEPVRSPLPVFIDTKVRTGLHPNWQDRDVRDRNREIYCVICSPKGRTDEPLSGKRKLVPGGKRTDVIIGGPEMKFVIRRTGDCQLASREEHESCMSLSTWLRGRGRGC